MIHCVDTDPDNQIVRIVHTEGSHVLVTLVFMSCYSSVYTYTEFFEKIFPSSLFYMLALIARTMMLS